MDHDKGESPEEKNEPNFRLYANWERVFRKIPGFEECTCLRRVRCPNHRGDMDFLLLTSGSDPKLGLVELEGYDAKAMQDKPVSRDGTEQLKNYLDWFRPYQGMGKEILQESIKNAFEAPLRKKHNSERWNGGFFEWAKKSAPDVATEDQVVDLLSAASQKLIAILLYYRTSKFTGDEHAMLGRSLTHRPFFVGTVWWPEADKLSGGKFL